MIRKLKRQLKYKTINRAKQAKRQRYKKKSLKKLRTDKYDEEKTTFKRDKYEKKRRLPWAIKGNKLTEKEWLKNDLKYKKELFKYLGVYLTRKEEAKITREIKLLRGKNTRQRFKMSWQELYLQYGKRFQWLNERGEKINISDEYEDPNEKPNKKRKSKKRGTKKKPPGYFLEPEYDSRYNYQEKHQKILFRKKCIFNWVPLDIVPPTLIPYNEQTSTTQPTPLKQVKKPHEKKYTDKKR